jgi:16S rRNA (guanine966-N2)-methyltransferase
MKKPLIYGKLRIQTGLCKGLKLWSPQDPQIRPTPAKMREAFSNLISFDPLPERIVIDLFAGSGSVGFEALSKGVRCCYFLDKHPIALESLKKNQTLHSVFEQRAKIWSWRAEWGFSRMQKNLPKIPRIVFADPPYERTGHDHLSQGELSELFQDQKGDLFWQRDRRTPSLELSAPFHLVKVHFYGRHALDHYRYLPSVSLPNSTTSLSN